MLISIAQLMVVLDATIANIALPYIGEDLDISQANLPGSSPATRSPSAGLLLLGGRLGDLYGRRRIFMIGLAIFASPPCSAASRTSEAAAARRPWPAGPRRRARLPRRARADHHDVPGRARPQPRVRGVRRDVRRRRRRRPDPRRLADRPRPEHRRPRRRRLAADLPDQRPDRHRRRRCSRRASCNESESHPGELDIPGAITGTLGLLGLVYGLTRAGDAHYGWGDAWTIASLVAGVVLLAAFVFIESPGRAPAAAARGSSRTAPGPPASW